MLDLEHVLYKKKSDQNTSKTMSVLQIVNGLSFIDAVKKYNITSPCFTTRDFKTEEDILNYVNYADINGTNIDIPINIILIL